MITFSGRQDNLALREAAFVALACNVAMVLLAMVVVLVAVPAGRPRQSPD